MMALKSKKITRASRKMSLRKQPESLAFKSLSPQIFLRKQPKSLALQSPSSKVRLLKEQDDEKMKEHPYSTSEGDAFVI